jgi:hypothetical protein
MHRFFILSLIASCAVYSSNAVRAELDVAIGVNHGEAATNEFKFDKVPSPSNTDAANQAIFTIVTGRRDSNGGDLDRLNDGRRPSEEDEPSANFFFAAGTEGGRLLVDLRDEKEIKSVNTYSWHRSTRGPQVYKLYGNDPDAADFDIAGAKARSIKLEEAGWKLLAEVDTRPDDGEPGGQYAVSISGSSGANIGKHRYLLFDISRTESDDAFGNTFFSEIDVVDGNEYPLSRRIAAHASADAELDVVTVAGKYEIAFDTSQMPEIKPWVEEKLKPACQTWYPKIVEMLPSDGFSAPTRFTIIFHKDMRGVANAGGRRINCAGPWFMRNLEGEAAGAVVHEMVHIVQQYGRSRGPNRNPGWMVEGLADYIRWFLYEPEELRPRPDPARAKYTDSYRTTGAFLNYLVKHVDKDVVKKFNAAMRAGRYSEDLWVEYTGKTIDELWADYIQTLRQ